jgi:hypothetical protein
MEHCSDSVSDSTSNTDTNVASSPPAACADPPVITFPALLGERFEIYRVSVDRLQGQFPACHVEQELREMQAWLEAHPRRRKTKKGMHSFITRWLSKEQDKASPGMTGAARRDYSKGVTENGGF